MGRGPHQGRREGRGPNLPRPPFRRLRPQGRQRGGATLEERVKKADNRGTAFADLVWKPVVLIEMKRRGENLTRHYRQAFDYWTRLGAGPAALRRALQLR